MNFYVEAAKKIADDLANCLDRLQDTYLTDKTQPLDERWAAYLAVEKFLPMESYGDGLIEHLGWDSPYDDLGVERHQTRKFSSVLEQVEENLDCLLDEEEPEHSYYDKYRSITPEMLNSWKEAVLASGYGSFTWDW